MSTLVNRPAPDFKATAVMADGSFKEIKLSDYKGKYVLLFFYPLDFTFVCPSEIIAHDHRIKEFESRNVQVIGVSIDSHFSHFAWRNTPVEKGGIGPVKFPLVSDIHHEITRAYGVEHQDGVAFRATFLIDKAGIVQHATINNLPLGRNVDEALRLIDALQFTEQHGEVCPAGWKKGDAGMKATPEGVAEYLAKNAAKL
ncbi:peroxiredoxin [Fontimonas thermophila]|nr:peroxiredoxin [Fontimonas thermophila]